MTTLFGKPKIYEHNLFELKIGSPNGIIKLEKQRHGYLLSIPLETYGVQVKKQLYRDFLNSQIFIEYYQHTTSGSGRTKRDPVTSETFNLHFLALDPGIRNTISDEVERYHLIESAPSLLAPQ